MPIVSHTSQKTIELQHNAIKALEELCSKIFTGKIADYIFTYSVCDQYETDDGPAMIAVAQYGNWYAVYAPEYFSEEQFKIFEYFLQKAEENDTFFVFSEKSRDAMRKYSYGKPVNVVLYI